MVTEVILKALALMLNRVWEGGGGLKICKKRKKNSGKLEKLRNLSTIQFTQISVKMPNFNHLT
jgi:hypothetical protein